MGRVFAALAVIWALSSAPETAAAPRVEVRARTTIELDSVRRVADGIMVLGRVVDANTGSPLPMAEVEVRAAELVDRVVTDGNGQFAAAFAVGDERIDISVRAFGNGLGESIASLPAFEVSKRPLELTLSIGPVTTTEVTVVLRASSEGEPIAGIGAPLHIDETPAQPIRTLEDGRGELRLPRTGKLAEPGRHTFSLRVAATELFDPASATATELLTVATSLEFAVPATEVPFEGHLVGRGRLTDGSGRAVQRARIDWMASTGDVVDAAMTDADGYFAFDVAADELGSGPVVLQAVFESPQPWFDSSRSRAVTITVAEPAPIPMGYTVGAFAATALALLAFVGLRTKPWLRWVNGDDGDDVVASEPIAARPVVGGLQPARASLISSVRRAHDVGCSFTVRDAVTRARLRAEVELVSASVTQRAETDGEGRVAFEDLAPGAWHGRAHARFYVAESFEVVIPHRGELRGAEIDLVEVRERIFDLYRDAALPHLPSPELWGIWTPRQIIDHVKAISGPAPALERLTAFVEDSYFSQRRPEDDRLALCTELVALARADAAR